MITIIDYNAGNILSVCNALDTLKIKYNVTQDKNEIKNAKKIIFPWVWHSRHAMNELKKLDLIKTIRHYKKPFLWICLWMQLLFNDSEEWNTKCLWIINDSIKKFNTNNNIFKIPHMWWNNISTVIAKSEAIHVIAKSVAIPVIAKSVAMKQSIPVIAKSVAMKQSIPVIAKSVAMKQSILKFNTWKYFYFVHSYYAPIWTYTLAQTNYINNFSSIVQKDNFIWVQFHPEKSWAEWLKILQNFNKI